jgi:succinate dehydrogenase / fumarate reductase, flavoprotein subunit
VVYGKRAGKAAAQYAKESAFVDLPADAGKKVEAELNRIRQANGSTRPSVIRQKMQTTMMDNVGVFREQAGMQKAVDELRELKEAYLKDLKVDDHGFTFNSDVLEAWELGCLIDVAQVTAMSAINRPESRGAHAREDFQKRDDANWLKHTMICQDDYGKVNITYKDVVITQYQPKERVY